MKNTILSAALLAFSAVTFMACNNAQPTETTKTEEGISGSYNVDVTNSIINWKGQMIGGIKSHTGTLSLSEGTLNIENGHIVGGNFTINMKSIKTTDDESHYDSAKGYGRGALVGHLESSDFFTVDTFPTASFVITSSDSTGVTGDLTIKGITNSEKINNVEIIQNENGITVKGEITFDRTKYGAVFQMAAKDMILSNDVELNIELTARP